MLWRKRWRSGRCNSSYGRLSYINNISTMSSNRFKNLYERARAKDRGEVVHHPSKPYFPHRRAVDPFAIFFGAAG